MARLHLMARAIASNDIPGTVGRFIAYVASNTAPALAVAGVSGCGSRRRCSWDRTCSWCR